MRVCVSPYISEGGPLLMAKVGKRNASGSVSSRNTTELARAHASPGQACRCARVRGAESCLLRQPGLSRQHTRLHGHSAGWKVSASPCHSIHIAAATTTTHAALKRRTVCFDMLEGKPAIVANVASE